MVIPGSYYLERSSGQIRRCLSSNKCRCSKILRKRKMAMKYLSKKLSNARFWRNLDDFWPRYCRAMKRNWNCVTCRNLFLTAERKGNFTCWGSDVLFLFLFGKLCRIELPLARLGHLGKSWWNISPGSNFIYPCFVLLWTVFEGN